MNKIILLFCLSITFLGNAQVSCYIIGGTSHAIDLSAKTQPGFNMGSIIDLPFSKAWSFQTGLNYNLVSTDSKWDVIEYVGEQSINFDDGVLSNYSFIEIPLTISTGIRLSENFKLKLNSGGYFSVFTGGSSLYRSSISNSNYVLPTYSYPIGGGFLFGAGLEINKLYLGVEANFNIPDGYKPITVLKTKIGIRL